MAEFLFKKQRGHGMRTLKELMNLDGRTALVTGASICASKDVT